MQEFLLDRAQEPVEVRRARTQTTNELTGPLETLATQRIVDPIRAIRPEYHGPRKPPSWWDEDEATDIAEMMVNQRG